MIRAILLLSVLSILYSCSAPKEYQIGNKMVTEKKYYREWKKVTLNYIKNANPEHLRTFLEMEVIYDTTSQK